MVSLHSLPFHSEALKNLCVQEAPVLDRTREAGVHAISFFSSLMVQTLGTNSRVTLEPSHCAVWSLVSTRLPKVGLTEKYTYFCEKAGN